MDGHHAAIIRCVQPPSEAVLVPGERSSILQLAVYQAMSTELECMARVSVHRICNATVHASGRATSILQILRV